MSLSKPATRKKINMNGIDPDRVYPMNLPILGHAVIINNLGDEFKGTKVDVEALEETFNAVGFITHVYSDCNKQEMWKIRSKFTRDEQHSQCNCFLMVVMCHGTKNGKLLDVKENEAFRIDQLIEEVSATKTLNGKPKLFIFDTCRGDEERYDSRGKASPDSNEEVNANYIKWPDLTDVFVAYPTMPGYQAYGGDDDGSIYQQALAQCLKEKFKTHDLSAIHRMVKQIMAREAQGDNTMQPAEERNGLRYLLKFGNFTGLSASHNAERPSVTLELASSVQHLSIAGGHKKKEKPPNRNTLAQMQVTRNIPASVSSTIIDQPKVLNKQGNLNVKEIFTTTLSTKACDGRSQLAIMPLTGDIAILKKNEGDTTNISLYQTTTAGVELKKTINLLCEHDVCTHILPFALEGREKLIAGCSACDEILSWDVNTSKLTTTLKHCFIHLRVLVGGDTSHIYTARRNNGSMIVCKLNCSQSKFTVCKSVQIEIQNAHSLCYVPKHELFVAFSISLSVVAAFMSGNCKKVWKMRNVVGPTCIVYSPEHDALLIGDSLYRVLVVNPEDGSLRQTLRLDQRLGSVWGLCVPKNNIFVQQNYVGGNVSVSCFALNQ